FSSTARDVVIAFTLLLCTSKNCALSYIEFVLQRDREPSVLRNRNALSPSEDPRYGRRAEGWRGSTRPLLSRRSQSRAAGPPFTAANQRSPAGGAVALHPGHRPQARLIAHSMPGVPRDQPRPPPWASELTPPPPPPAPPPRAARPPPRAPGARLTRPLPHPEGPAVQSLQRRRALTATVR